MTSTNGLRPLYLVDDIAKDVGKEVTYAYDDLVFIEDSEVLIQFADDPPNALHLFIHQDIDEESCQAIKAKYEIVARAKSTPLTYKGRFTFSPDKETKEITVQFFPRPGSRE
ncbi:MAG: hypothetical protein LAT55_13310 [Opitutales bacterium]|nr:hypothetical protein [Opitutales bacterium]